MAIRSIPFTMIPDINRLSVTSYPTTAGVTASDGRCATVVQATDSFNLTEVIFTTGAVTIGGSDFVLAIETVGTDGLPTGTLWGTGTQTSPFTIYTGTNNTEVTATLGTAATLNQGDTFAIVLYNSSLPGAFTLRRYSDGITTVAPYQVNYSGGSWGTKVAGPFAGSLKDSNGNYHPLAQNSGPVLGSAATVVTINTSSSPDEIGNVFSPVIPYQICGVFARITAAGVNNVFDLVLYEGNTAIRTITGNPRARSSSGGVWLFMFSSSYVLDISKTYRIILKPTSTSNVGIDVQYWGGSNRHFAAPGNGLWKQTQRTDAGSWTDSDSAIVQIGLIANGLSVPEFIESY